MSGPSRSVARRAGMEVLVGALCLCIGPAAPAWAAPAPQADEARQDAEGGEAEIRGWSTLTTGGSYRVEIEADPHPIPLNEMFSLSFRITEGGEREDRAEGWTPVSGVVVTASARMPEHQHGTNFQPRITSHGDGTATGVGFLWHMEGKWDLHVGVAAAGKMEWAVFSFELEP